MDSPVIEHSRDNDRFILSVGGERVGHLTYRDSDGSRTFVHTQVEEAHEGHGYGTRLIERAVAESRAEGLRLVAECPMVAHWLGEHPEFDEFVDAR